MTVRLLADESLDAAIMFALRSAGWTVDFVAEMSPGLDDDSVLALIEHTFGCTVCGGQYEVMEMI